MILLLCLLINSVFLLRGMEQEIETVTGKIDKINQQLQARVAQLYGGRNYQQDYYDYRPYTQNNPFHYYAVFDGHGNYRTGHTIAQYLAAKLYHKIVKQNEFKLGLEHNNIEFLKRGIRYAFAAANKKILKSACSDAGSTAAIALITSEFILCAWAGDSRIIIGEYTECDDGKFKIVSTHDHCLNDTFERDRVVALGGKITIGDNGDSRVNGILSMTRAFGNKTISHYVQPTPDFIVHKRSGKEFCVLLATDGFFEGIFTTPQLRLREKLCVKDKFNPDMLANYFALRLVQEIRSSSMSGEEQNPAQWLVERCARNPYDNDNKTVMLVDLSQHDKTYLK